MDEVRGDIGHRCHVALDINASHSYRAGELGVLEFRIRNEASWRIPTLEIRVDCPCEHSGRKSATLRNLSSASEKKQPFRFEPGRSGAALLEIEVACEGQDGMPLIYRGQTCLNVAAKEDARSAPNISLDVHDLFKESAVQRSDLKGLITIAAGDRDQDRGSGSAEPKEPRWVPVDLDLDEAETEKRRQESRRICSVPAGQAQTSSQQARLESLDPAAPRRIFIYSMPEVRFGRHTQRNNVVLRFLPDFYRDERSKTISGEQFVVRYAEGKCLLALAPGARAPLSLNRRMLLQGEEIALIPGSDLRIGTHDFGLCVSCFPKVEDDHWARSRDELRRSDPGDDRFRASSWDCLVFTRTSNGPEEEYVWILRKIALDWDPAETAGLKLGPPAGGRARLSFWNGHHYLEVLDPAAEVEVGARRLKPGDIARLGAQTELSFGASRFSWTTL